MQYTEKFIEIDAPVERVFDLFSDFENFPRWMRHIRDVHRSGRRYTRWTADAPLGSAVEWEAETTVFEPDHKIAWRSVRGDVDTEGEVIFEETARGTTLMHIVLGYNPPAGRLGAMVASLFGNNPERQMEEDLERFAAVAEGRRPTGGRSRDYDDRRPRENFTRDRSHPRDERYEARGARDPRERPRRRFDEELRAARRSQLEGQRRYAEERERDERRRYRAERDERVRMDMRESRPPERYRAEESRRDERPHRHALTPRERARERREPDYGYTETAFSRGVDKLMDDAPSNRWRR